MGMESITGLTRACIRVISSKESGTGMAFGRMITRHTRGITDLTRRKALASTFGRISKSTKDSSEMTSGKATESSTPWPRNKNS